MVRNATSSWDPDGRLQRQVLENPSPWADPSHHLQQMRQINQADTQESLFFFLCSVRHSLVQTGSRCWPKTWAWRRHTKQATTFHQQQTHIFECQEKEKDCGTSGVFYLWTVCEAIRKDMRSPADISLLLIKVPPAKIVPRTMPVHWKK